MEGDHPHSPSPLPPATAVSAVLSNDDLLGEILLRVGFPTTLVRASLVCKRWLRFVSHPALHPPRLLGYFVATYSRDGTTDAHLPNHPHFIPVQPHPPELDPVIRRGRFGCGAEAYDTFRTGIMNCRNDHVLLCMRRRRRDDDVDDPVYEIGVHCPLHPERGLVMFPQPPIYDDDDPFDEEFVEGMCHHQRGLLLREDNGDVLALSVKFGIQGKVCARVYAARGGAWKMHTTVMTRLPDVASVYDVVMVQDKVFIAGGTPRTVLVLDVMSSSFYTIPLPDGVVCGNRKHDIMVGRAGDDSGVYIAEMKEPLLELRIWLHKVGGDGWTLVDTIGGLPVMCADLGIDGVGGDTRILYLNAVGDDAVLDDG
uniref:Uncharacterized protein n=1 Tax=Leersia perrieri TaxID=77586 RepID=A0A0D9VEZ1_9ORYZ